MNSHISPFTGYKLYNALKLHFTNDKYDFFEQKGKIRIKGETFDNKDDVECYIKMTSTIEKKDIMYFLLANFLQGNYNLIYNLNSGNPIYRDWKKRMDSLSHIFISDIECIENELEDVASNMNSIFQGECIGSHPLLLRMYMGGYISIETMCILEIRVGYIERFNLLLGQNDFIWKNKRKMIVKYIAFFINGKIPAFYSPRIKKKILDTFPSV